MDNGSVVAAAERVADLEKRGIRLFAHDIHGNLARPGNLAVALLAFEAFQVDIVVLAYAFQNLRDGQYRVRFALDVEVLKGFGGQADRERSIVQRGIGNDAIE